MSDTILRLLREEDGASAIEYGLIAGLIAVGLVTVLTDAGSALRDIFQTIANALTDAASGVSGDSGTTG
jgi:pilus assembly protein Flp/PilA